MFGRFRGSSAVAPVDDDDESSGEEEEQVVVQQQEDPVVEQQQKEDDDDDDDDDDDSYHPACRYRAENGALFTSSKCPPGPGLENSCELPFGLLYTPLAVQQQQGANAPTLPQIPCVGQGLPPGILCLTCLGYLNLYATFDVHSGIWNCPLCGAQNVAPKDAFTTTLSSALVSPMLEFRQPLLLPQAPQNQQQTNVDVSTLIIVMDANLPRSEAHAVGRALQSIVPEMLAMKSDSRNKKKQQRQVNLGLVVFSNVVTIYQLGIAGMASADVFTTHQDLTEHHLQSRMYLAPTTRSDHCALDALSRCLAAVYGQDDDDDENAENVSDNRVTRHTISPHKLSRLEMLKKKKQERLRKQEQQEQQQFYGQPRQQPSAPAAKSPWTAARERMTKNAQEHYSHAHRCTGEAIQCAIDLTTLGKVAAAAEHDDTCSDSRTSRILLFTNGCPNHGDGSVVATTAPSSSNNKRLGGFGSRISSPDNKKKSHPHAPPDTVDSLKLARAIEYFDILARAASDDNGTAVDVFCTGATELAVASYQALVGPSSGYVLTHDSFDQTPHLRHNLSFLLKHTSVSSCGGDHHHPVLQHPQQQQHGADHDSEDDNSDIIHMNGCIIDVRVTEFLTPTHLVGPGDLLQEEADKTLLANERSAFSLGSSLAANRGIPTSQLPSREVLDTTLTRVRMGRADPLSTFYLMFAVNDVFEKDKDTHAVFQCSVRFVSRDGSALVTRVSTHRLPIAKNVGEYVDAVDEEVVPVIMGKEAVYRSMFGRELSEDSTNGNNPINAPSPEQLERLAYRTQQDLDATIARISGAFRLLGLEQGNLRGLDLTEEGGVRAAGSSVDFAFPPELSDALRRLYHLRRGPLLSPGPMRSLDDRADIRSLFLRFPLEDCLNMMAPSLWSTSVNDDNAGMLEEFPPETLALWEDRVIAADNFNTVFVWSGRQASQHSVQHEMAQQECRELLQRRTERRFPMPHLHVLSEGDSMSRRFTALLAPSHGDPIDHSLAHFSALARLSSDELMALRSKFRFYDPNTDPSFRGWFWSVAGATSNAKDDGLSLCE